MVISYYIKLFREGADRHNGILISLLLLVSETITFISSMNQKQASTVKICSKFTGDHPCRSTISIKLLCNFIEMALRHGWSPVNLLQIFRTSFPKNTCRRLLLNEIFSLSLSHCSPVLLISTP